MKFLDPKFFSKYELCVIENVGTQLMGLYEECVGFQWKKNLFKIDSISVYLSVTLDLLENSLTDYHEIWWEHVVCVSHFELGVRGASKYIREVGTHFPSPNIIM